MIRVLIFVVNIIVVSCGKMYCKLVLDIIFWLGVFVMYYKFNLIGMYVMFLGVMIVLYLVMIFILKRRGRFGNRVMVELV